MLDNTVFCMRIQSVAVDFQGWRAANGWSGMVSVPPLLRCNDYSRACHGKVKTVWQGEANMQRVWLGEAAGEKQEEIANMELGFLNVFK